MSGDHRLHVGGASVSTYGRSSRVPRATRAETTDFHVGGASVSTYGRSSRVPRATRAGGSF